MDGDGTPAAKLLEWLDGCRVTQTLHACAALGIADHLAAAARNSDELAATVAIDTASLRRLLRALAALGVLEERRDGRYALTATGELLRSDVSGSLRAAVLFAGGRRAWTSWGRLSESVRSGRPAFGTWSRRAFAEMAARDPEGARLFHQAMGAFTQPVAAAVVAAHDFSAYPRVVDVGGGYGALLSAVLRAHPRLRGVLFDLPDVVAGAREKLAAAGLGERCALVAGDVFEWVPRGGDAYVLKSIVHDWDDELAGRILASCRSAMGPTATLLLVERVLPAAGEIAADDATKFLSDLNMLLLAGGRERSEEEYRALLAAVGFELCQVVATATAHSLIVARPCASTGGVSALRT